MESIYGFVVTSKGRNLFAKLSALGEPLKITRVMFGTGKMPEGSTVKDMMDMTDLVETLAQGTSTTPVFEEDTFSLIAEFRSDLNGGLEKTSWLNEFGLFAADPEGGDTMIGYASLGDYPDSVRAYKDGRITVRDYPVSITIGEVSEVILDFSAGAYITSEEAQRLIVASVGGMVGLASFDFTIPVSAWIKDEAATDSYVYYADVENEIVSLSHFPDATLDKTSLDAACACGMAPTAETPEAGKVRFFAQAIPTAAISGTCKLWTKGNNASSGEEGGGSYELPIASATTLGGVKIGEGIEVAADGTISSEGTVSPDQIAQDGDVEEMLNEVFGNHNEPSDT